MCDLTAKAIGVDPAEFRRKNFVPASRVPVPDAGRVPVRQRELRAGPRPGAPDDRLPEVPRRAGSRAEAGPLPGDRVRHLHRGLRAGALRGGGRARRPGRPLGERSGSRPPRPGRSRSSRARTPTARGTRPPSPSWPPTSCRCPVRGRRDRPRRHRAASPSAWAPTAAARRAVGGSAIYSALEKIKEKGKKIAAHLLEASEADIEYAGRQVRGQGLAGPRQDVRRGRADGVPGAQPARGARAGARGDVVLRSQPTSCSPSGPTSPSSRSSAATGKVKLVRYVAVDDVGNVINPMIVDGMVHGGIAQGVGQALYEYAAYDDERPAPERQHDGLRAAQGGRSRRPTRRTGP